MKTAISHLLFNAFALVMAHSAESASPLLDKFDGDKDGFLSVQEIPAMLRSRMERMDPDGDGKLSARELERVPAPAVQKLLRGETTPGRPSSRKAPRKPGEVYAPAAREEATAQLLEIGDEAPDFTLTRWDGDAEVTLSSFEGEKPVVLVFGSITCSPFRQKVLGVKPVFETYKDRAEFLMVYIREAHPESIIEVEVDGAKVLKKFEQTDDYASRVESASHCTALLELPFPVFVDGDDNAVKNAYAGWPIRLMVVGKDGRIRYDSGKGPKGFEPAKLDQWLEANL